MPMRKKANVAIAGNCEETLRQAKHLSGSIQSGSEYISTSATATMHTHHKFSLLRYLKKTKLGGFQKAIHTSGDLLFSNP